MIKLVYVKNGVTKDVTAFTGNYVRSDNVESLGMSFTFELLNNPLDYMQDEHELEVGGKVVLSNNGTTIFSGIIIGYDRNSLNRYSYRCYDYGFYLNKNEAIIQFNGVSVSNALKRLCSESSVPVGQITNISTVVNKIYNGEKISDIIKDLLKLATDELGTKYRLEVRDNKLYIQRYEDLVLTVFYKPAYSVRGFDPTQFVGDFSSSYSIEEMSNRVVVTSGNEKHAQTVASVEDGGNISTYGLLTKVEKVDGKNRSQAMQIAKTKLKELNKVTRSFSITLYGDDRVRSGRMLVFNQPEINLVGTFLVKSCTHTYTGKTQFMELELEV